MDSFDEEYLKNVKILDDEKIKNQIDVLNKFHKISMGGYLPFFSIKNNIGKQVENNKKNIKKVKRLMENINSYNEFENKIKKDGIEYIERAESAMNKIYFNEYLKIVKRSMERNEIIIKNSYFSNIRIDNNIEIINIDNVSYDLVEMDIVYFLIKIINKRHDFDYKEYVKYFIEIEGLGEESEGFINAMISYPYNFMKCIVRYIERKKEWDINVYINKLDKAMKQDFISLD
ncbi:MAG: spore coat protein [Clostridiaceae bacterium]